MEAYDRMRREIVQKLEHNPEINIDAILSAMDDVVCGYNVTARETEGNGMTVLQDYLSSCEYEKMSEGTINNYRLIIGRLLSELNIPVAEIRTVDLRNYLRRYQEKHGVSDVTLDKYREYLRAFFGWCCNEGYCERNPAAELRKIRYETKPREGFSQTELEYIRQACRDRRDLAIIEVLYSTGCRVSELCCLKKSDIDWGNKTVHLFGKGRKHRNSYLNAKAEVTLREYLNHRTDESEYLFVTKRGSHEMTPAAVQKVLRDLGKTISDKVGKRISPHIFRHTTATTALRNGMPLEDIQALLGHENIETTLVYAKTSAETVQMNHRRYII